MGILRIAQIILVSNSVGYSNNLIELFECELDK